MLVEMLATSRARIAEFQTSWREDKLMEEVFWGLAVSYIRRTLSVRAKSYSLPGRLDSMKPGAVLALGRRSKALEQERLWAREKWADALAASQRFNIILHCTSFPRDLCSSIPSYTRCETSRQALVAIDILG